MMLPNGVNTAKVKAAYANTAQTAVPKTDTTGAAGTAAAEEEEPVWLIGHQRPSHSDEAELTAAYRQMKEEYRDRLEELQRLVGDSSETIRKMAEKLKPMQVERKAVPSAVGLSLNAAASKLKRSDLKIRSVSQEYNANIPRGHVISQVPGPGSSAAKKNGVKIVISKGPPPDQEKYDIVKKREKLAYKDHSRTKNNKPATPKDYLKKHKRRRDDDHRDDEAMGSAEAMAMAAMVSAGAASAPEPEIEVREGAAQGEGAVAEAVEVAADAAAAGMDAGDITI